MDWFAAVPGWMWEVSVCLFGLFWFFHCWMLFVRGAKFHRAVAGLEGDYFAHYREALRDGLVWLSHLIGDNEEPVARVLSKSSYSFCLGMALIYPIYFLTFAWLLFGGTGRFGSLQFLPEHASGLFKTRILLLALAQIWAVGMLRLLGSLRVPYRGLAVFVVATVVASLATGPTADAHVVVAIMSGCTIFFMMVYQIGEIFCQGKTAADLGASSFLGNIGFFFAVVASFSAAGPGVALDIVFMVVLFVGFVAVFSIATIVMNPAVIKTGRGWRLGAIILAATLVPAFTLAALDGSFSAIDLTGNKAFSGSLVVFLALLPAVNAPFDWLSLGITRKIIGWVSKEGEDIYVWFGNPWIGKLLTGIAIVLNIILALGLAILVAVATAGGIALFSRLEVLGGTRALYSVSHTIAAIRADPGNREFWWIYAMMAWTLVPTVIHFISFAGTFVAQPLQSTHLGAWLARQLKAVDTDSLFQRAIFIPFPALLLTLVRVGPGLTAIAFLIGQRENVLGALHWLLKFVWPAAPQSVAGWGNQICDWSLYVANAIEGASPRQLFFWMGGAFCAAVALAFWGGKKVPSAEPSS